MSELCWLRPGAGVDDFPPVEAALTDPPGLLAVGGDLSLPRLLAAYQRGIFPWFAADQPILWWSPDPRCVLRPERFHCSHSLRKRLRSGSFAVTVNQCFEAVMTACGDAQLRPEGSWIHAQMVRAYLALHHQQLAHSIEIWRDGALVGGLYGVQLGAVFFGESMFSIATDASKVALWHLSQQILPQRVRLIDCQMPTPHLLSLGAETLPRTAFLLALKAHLAACTTAAPSA